MPRDTARRLAQNPGMVHTEVLRDFAGSVQMTSTSATFSGVSATPTTVVDFDDLLAFTSAVFQVTATANSPTAATVLDGLGRTVTTIAGPITPATTTSLTQQTHTTPLNAPNYQVQAQGGTITGTLSVTREQRV